MVDVKDIYEPIPENVARYNEVYKMLIACDKGLGESGFPDIYEFQNKI